MGGGGVAAGKDGMAGAMPSVDLGDLKDKMPAGMMDSVMNCCKCGCIECPVLQMMCSDPDPTSNYSFSSLSNFRWSTIGGAQTENSKHKGGTGSGEGCQYVDKARDTGDDYPRGGSVEDSKSANAAPIWAPKGATTPVPHGPNTKFLASEYPICPCLPCLAGPGACMSCCTKCMSEPTSFCCNWRVQRWHYCMNFGAGPCGACCGDDDTADPTWHPYDMYIGGNAKDCGRTGQPRGPWNAPNICIGSRMLYCIPCKVHIRRCCGMCDCCCNCNCDCCSCDCCSCDCCECCGKGGGTSTVGCQALGCLPEDYRCVHCTCGLFPTFCHPVIATLCCGDWEIIQRYDQNVPDHLLEQDKQLDPCCKLKCEGPCCPAKKEGEEAPKDA